MPLWVLGARVFDVAFAPWIGTAQAIALLSATCTALACALLARLVARWSGNDAIAVAAGLAAGVGSTVWSSATEAEVYGAALLLVAFVLTAADRVRERDDPASRGALAYALGLGAAVHLGTLVVAPGAVSLTFARRARAPRAASVAVVGAAVAAFGAATASLTLVAAGVATMGLAAARARADGLRAATAWLLATTALLAMLVRARAGPAVNQADPSTLERLVQAVGRTQYAHPGLWPRQAPVWLQLANVFQYLDWQFSLGIAPTVAFSPVRASITALYVALAVAGSLAHRRAHAPSWRAVAVLALCASVGVVAYLNLKAGASLGYGIVADRVPHEVRERDYFFATLFWIVSGWSGWGAVAVATTVLGARAAPVGVVIAALPVALNARAMDRRAEPDASLARTVAIALLRSAPRRAVLLSAGDNDSYPLWYAQLVEGERRDVTVVTLPLAGAAWYRRELAVRYGLFDSAGVASWRGEPAAAAGVARAADRIGRPVVAAVTVAASTRQAVGGDWRQRGLVWERVVAGEVTGDADAVTREIAALVAPHVAVAPAPSIDQAPAGMRDVLRCAAASLAPPGDSAAAALLDSRCNRR